ncbi:MAG: thiamine-phosphate synthase family protein [Candidatus Thorarchaeota archaeon]
MVERTHSLKEQLKANIHAIVKTAGFERLIPEVGSNFVGCLLGTTKLKEVAGLTGRIILDRGRPVAIGDVDFGWAPFMGQVLLKAHSLNKQILSAISVRNTPDIVDASRHANLQVVGYRLPENKPPPDCMTLMALNKLGFVPEVLFDWGAHGLEPLVIVFGSSPREVRVRVQKIIGELLASE